MWGFNLPQPFVHPFRKTWTFLVNGNRLYSSQNLKTASILNRSPKENALWFNTHIFTTQYSFKKLVSIILFPLWAALQRDYPHRMKSKVPEIRLSICVMHWHDYQNKSGAFWSYLRGDLWWKVEKWDPELFFNFLNSKTLQSDDPRFRAHSSTHW